MRVLIIAPNMALRFGLSAMLQSIGLQAAGQQSADRKLEKRQRRFPGDPDAGDVARA